MKQIQNYTFKSENPGPSILLIGGVHGNEYCGSITISKLITEIQSGKTTLISGSITCLPICNPEGYKQNKRFIEENLARIFFKINNPLNYEQTLAQEIIPYIHQSDYILDIHSMSAQGSSFVFQDYEITKYKELALSTQIPLIVKGRSNIYESIGQQDITGYANNTNISYLLVAKILFDKARRTVRTTRHTLVLQCSISKIANTIPISVLKFFGEVEIRRGGSCCCKTCVIIILQVVFPMLPVIPMT